MRILEVFGKNLLQLLHRICVLLNQAREILDVASDGRSGEGGLRSNLVNDPGDALVGTHALGNFRHLAPF